jgi:biopolymer transport protein ExbD
MKQSLRAKRMAKHHKRQKQQTKLNLVSLMDIFTILVFFLLLNSSDVEVLQNDKTITLPESVAEQKPETTLVVMVNNQDVLVSGRSVAKVETILANPDAEIESLSRELNYQASRAEPLSEQEAEKGRAVTIMGDESVPYALLKKVMTTCAAADYRKISLAVTKIASAATAEAVEG